MKILKIAIPLVLFVSIGLFYFLIPSTIKISTFKVASSHELSVIRVLNSPSLLAKSMSPYYDSSKHHITIDDIVFTPNAALSNIIQLNVATNNISTKSFITANSINKETTAINWFAEIKTSWNPIQRVKDYKEAIRIKKTTAQLLQHLNDFVEKPENIYGLDIKEITLKDTVLISTKFVNKQLPTNNQIYKAVDELTKYLTSFKKMAQNNPMVTVLENPTKDYTIMVGISINGEIPETAIYKIKKMPTNGKMFIADVKGGPATIRNGYEALKSFLQDTKRPSPAVPFELLNTDRRQVNDTSKWETRIYYPVM